MKQYEITWSDYTFPDEPEYHTFKKEFKNERELQEWLDDYLSDTLRLKSVKQLVTIKENVNVFTDYWVK